MDNNKFTLYKENALSFALVEKYKSNVKIPKVKVCLQLFFFYLMRKVVAQLF